MTPWSSLPLASTHVRLVAVEGDSMRPAIRPGDRLLVVRRRRYRVGEVVALRDPRDGRTILKRVESVDDINLMVAGDNGAASTDSRIFGSVSVSSVLGRAVYRYAPPGRAGRLR